MATDFRVFFELWKLDSGWIQSMYCYTPSLSGWIMVRRFRHREAAARFAQILLLDGVSSIHIQRVEVSETREAR